MATVSKWTPFGVALDITATAATITRTSATQYTVKINVSWETYYSGAQTNYGMSVTSGGVTSTISSFGTKRSSGSGTITGTYSISGNGSATKTVTVTFKNFNTDNGDSASKAVSFSVTVPAWTSYTIAYNANGGSGAPGSQTKWKDQTLTLSSTKPTRTGYSFLGWSTSSTATSATYSAGGNYTANAAATLYAVWKPNTYTVTYNANGGTGAPASQTKTYNVALTLSSTKPTRTNYTFKGWGTSASATTVSYAAGGTYSTNSAITLYAIWELTYVKPSMSGFSVNRCDTNGNVSDDGIYSNVKFSWKTSVSVKAVTIEYRQSGAASWSSITVATSGTSGTVNRTINTVTFSTDKTYDFRITINDGTNSLIQSAMLSAMIYLMDFKSGGKGIAFGKPAELDNIADFGFQAMFRDKAIFANNTCVYGTKPDGTVYEAINIQNGNGNLVFGYDNYDKANGSTNMYGYDINFGVSNIATPGTYRPYRRRGDSITISLRTAGYVTNAGKEVSFWIPMSEPIIGSPKVTIASGNGFTLRQSNGYTHGSSASSYVNPDSYEATLTMFNGIHVTAKFSNTTNVVNNDTIGIYWNGTITFS